MNYCEDCGRKRGLDISYSNPREVTACRFCGEDKYCFFHMPNPEDPEDDADSDDYDFGDHEVTDRAAMLMELVSEKLCDHTKVRADQGLRVLAENARDALYELYQLAGAKMVRRKD